MGLEAIHLTDLNSMSLVILGQFIKAIYNKENHAINLQNAKEFANCNN